MREARVFTWLAGVVVFSLSVLASWSLRVGFLGGLDLDLGEDLDLDLLGGKDDDDGREEGLYMNSEIGILSPGEVDGGNLR